MKAQLKAGFTLVEIMIVVAIIAILAAVAIPNFVNYRNKAHQNACIGNMKQIQSACEQIKLAGKDPTDKSLLYGKDGYIKVEPHCPADNSSSYEIKEVNGEIQITCGNGGTANFEHKLPDADEKKE